MKSLHLVFCAVLLSLAGAFAQNPQINPLEPPMITPAPVQGAQRGSEPDATVLTAIKTLEDLRATNIEIIQKQRTTMELLDQLAKDADQMRIFSKRG